MYLRIHKFQLIILIIISIYLFFAISGINFTLNFENRGKLKDSVWELKVIEVVDTRFPQINEEQLNIILEEAKRLLKLKLNQEVKFIYKGKILSKEFIDKGIKGEKKGDRRWDIFNVFFRIYLENRGYPCEILIRSKSCFWEDKKDDCNILRKEMYSRYLSSIEKIKNLKLEDGSSLITKSNIKYYSSYYWGISLEKGWSGKIGESFQSDIYLINSPIVIDDPFSLFPSNMDSALLKGIAPLGVGISLFPITTNFSYFKEKIGNIDEVTKYKIIGFILAHEISGYLFGLPDQFVDKTRGCLMDVSCEKIGKIYEKVVKKGACSGELNFVEKVATIRMCRELARDGRELQAIEHLKKIIVKYPDDAFAIKELALLYGQIGNKEEADKIWRQYNKIVKKKKINF